MIGQDFLFSDGLCTLAAFIVLSRRLLKYDDHSTWYSDNFSFAAFVNVYSARFYCIVGVWIILGREGSRQVVGWQ